MRLRGTLHAMPTLLRVGFAEALAYRTELLIWVLSTTMPLIMLALWSAVAGEAPVGRFGQAEFTAYFLATFIVRQLTSSWASWQMNYEVRNGALSMRLLKPVHPMWAYAAEHLAALPLRALVSIPMAFIALVVVRPSHIPHDWLLWAIWVLSMIGAWLITFFVGVSIGCLSFYLESSLKVTDVWLALFFVLSGYLIPVELFPKPVRILGDWLPFRYQVGLPVEIMTMAYGRAQALEMLLKQWGFVIALLALAGLMWRRGVRHYEAYGG